MKRIYEIKRGQSALEFAILIGAVLFFVAGFIFAVQNNISDRNRERRQILIEEIASLIQDEINLASVSSDGYYREFTLPGKVLGLDYIATLDSRTVYVHTVNELYTTVLPIQSVVGDIEVGGVNMVSKVEDNICLNSEIVVCSSCGNGNLESFEVCDGELFDKEYTCGESGESELFNFGEVTCGNNCELDTALCSYCGNGKTEGLEVCDGDVGVLCEGGGAIPLFKDCLSTCDGWGTCNPFHNGPLLPACDNGIDDDGDGFVDWDGVNGVYELPYDPYSDDDKECEDADDDNEMEGRDPFIYVCNDGYNNDGDPYIDFIGGPQGEDPDPECAYPYDLTGESIEGTPYSYDCSNGIDDDGDGFIDWGEDPQCISYYDLSEHSGTFPEDFQCMDGVDNDGDNLIDWPADPECAYRYDDESSGIGYETGLGGGLVAHYLFDGTSLNEKLADESGENNESIVGSADCNQTGISGTACGFLGVGNYVNVPNNNEFNLPNNYGEGLSVTIWIKTSANVVNGLVDKSEGNERYGIWLSKADDKCGVSIKDAEGDELTYSGGGDVVDGTWHMCAFTAVRSNPANPDELYVKLYSDGQMVQDYLVTNIGDISPNGDFKMGVLLGGAGTANIIDEVRVYGKAVSNQDILDIYDSLTG